MVKHIVLVQMIPGESATGWEDPACCGWHTVLMSSVTPPTAVAYTDAEKITVVMPTTTGATSQGWSTTIASKSNCQTHLMAAANHKTAGDKRSRGKTKILQRVKYECSDVLHVPPTGCRSAMDIKTEPPAAAQQVSDVTTSFRLRGFHINSVI